MQSDQQNASGLLFLVLQCSEQKENAGVALKLVVHGGPLFAFSLEL